MIRHNRLAFTLVELLVVVAIIALLMAILLPALKKARRSVRTTVCLTNLHQIGQAVYMYAADYEGAIVPAWWSISANSGPCPGYPINPSKGVPDYDAYSSDSPFLGQYTDPQYGSQAVKMIGGMAPANTRSVWFCPEDQPKHKIGGDHWGVNYAESRTTYPTNWAGGGWSPSLWKLAAARSPAHLLSFVDATSARFSSPAETDNHATKAFYGNDPGNLSGGTDPYNWGAGGTPMCMYSHGVRHLNNITPALFLDGHTSGLVNEWDDAAWQPVYDSYFDTSVGQYPIEKWSLRPAWQRGEFVLDRNSP